MISKRLDAKKRAKVVKPVYFNNTKSGTASNVAAACGLLFTFLCGGVTLWAMKTYNLDFKPSFVTKYFTSPEIKVEQARLRGLIPPRFDLREKYFGKRPDEPGPV